MDIEKTSSEKALRLSGIGIPALFILFRMILFVSLPHQSIPGYGDYWNFFHQAGLGFPYLDFWTEFPPVFPVISRVIYLVVNGRSSAYDYLLAGMLTILQGVSIWLSVRILEIVRPGQNPINRGWVYFIFTAGLFYTWSYFDTLVVLFTLFAIYAVIKEKDGWAVTFVSLGILTKWFPILLLPAVWKIRKPLRALTVTLASLAIVALVWGGFYIASPEMTGASLVSQVNKGSWETIWALLDGNLQTGNFSAESNRLVPATASLQVGNPSVVPSWLTLIVFGGFGLYLLLRSKPINHRWLIDFLGLSLVIFFIWSPGYSPQWVIYLIPLILISLDEREAVLFAAVLILINLLEWPLLLSRGKFWTLWYLVPLRSALMAFLGFRFYQMTLGETYRKRTGGQG